MGVRGQPVPTQYPFDVKLLEQDASMVVAISYELCKWQCRPTWAMHHWRLLRLRFDDVNENVVKVLGIDVVCDLGNGTKKYVKQQIATDGIDEIEAALDAMKKHRTYYE